LARRRAMQIINLYDNIYKLIANNQKILYYLGMSSDASHLDKAKKIQRRAKPQDLIDNVPLISYYALPGGVDKRNDIVYVAPFVFNIFTFNDVDAAHSIAEELTDTIDKKLLSFEGVENLESRLITAHESGVDEEDIYCFTVVFEFSVII